MSSSTPEQGTGPAPGQTSGQPLDPDQRASSDPLGAASELDASEEDPSASATADLPGHAVDEVVDDASAGPVQAPSIGPPSQDHR